MRALYTQLPAAVLSLALASDAVAAGRTSGYALPTGFEPGQMTQAIRNAASAFGAGRPVRIWARRTDVYENNTTIDSEATDADLALLDSIVRFSGTLPRTENLWVTCDVKASKDEMPKRVNLWLTPYVHAGELQVRLEGPDAEILVKMNAEIVKALGLRPKGSPEASHTGAPTTGDTGVATENVKGFWTLSNTLLTVSGSVLVALISAGVFVGKRKRADTQPGTDHAQATPSVVVNVGTTPPADAADRAQCERYCLNLVERLQALAEKHKGINPAIVIPDEEYRLARWGAEKQMFRIERGASGWFASLRGRSE